MQIDYLVSLKSPSKVFGIREGEVGAESCSRRGDIEGRWSETPTSFVIAFAPSEQLQLEWALVDIGTSRLQSERTQITLQTS